MASNSTQQYDTATIRQLLLEAFTPEELRRFCYDRPTFRPVVRRFGPGYGYDDMIDELITYCENYLVFPELLTELKQHNPRQYARFIEPAPSTSEILTVSHPISLQLVHVPAGDFQVGSVMARDRDARDNELPPHPVYVPEFHVGKYPVTNFQYQAFVQATGHRAPDAWAEGRIPRGKNNHPAVNVSWHDALAFCTWLSRETPRSFGLPTEAEWEKAARGTDGRIYPWGDESPDEYLCNFDNNIRQTTPIGRYSPQGDSPYGCADMAGNVWEWCRSLRKPYPYQAGDGREALEEEGSRVLRGGRFGSSGTYVRCAYRFGYDPYRCNSSLGFRVVVAPGTSEG